jgi:hypothetical protein
VLAETAFGANRLRLIRGCAASRLARRIAIMVNESLPARRFFETEDATVSNVRGRALI